MRYDIIVIGGGTAGLVTASGCARLGRRVALVERDALGGDCLWTGCVPTKALVASARLAYQASRADAFGFDPVRLRIDPARIMESMREERRRISRHDDPEKFRALGIDVIFGSARFLSPAEIEVDGRKLQAKHFVIATGSRTRVPLIEGLEETGFVDHVSFLQRDTFPSSMAILGGGAIGVEFAQMLRRLGCEVTIVEMLDQVVSREDPEIAAFVRALLEAEGIAIRTGWKAALARREGSRKILEITRGTVMERIDAEEIFVACGRRGNVEGLGLDAAGVEIDRSWVRVDEYLRTTAPRIWACGDVHGGMQFTHVAAYEAVKLVRNILYPFGSKADYGNIPCAIYTDPEIAHVGLTEPEAIERFGADSVRSWRVDMEDVDRAVVDRSTGGFLKIVTGKRRRILGAHAAGTHASTLIGQLVLARMKDMTIGELAQIVSPYPSLSDAISKAGALYYQELGRSWLGALARKVAAWTR